MAIEERPYIHWSNVIIATIFLVLDIVVTFLFGLEIGPSLVVAGIRCVLQLALVGSLLRLVFEADNVLTVAFIAIILNLLATCEIVINKSRYRHPHMFSAVFVSMLLATIPVSVIGSRFAMSVEPFWHASRYIPILGMLAGSTIPAVIITIQYVHRQVYVHHEETERMLAFGASRIEACKPIAIESLRLAIVPTINHMSIIGIISIPGMMTGAILAGAPVEQAARLQMIVIFMNSASTVLATVTVTFATLVLIVDSDHRIRTERMDPRLHVIWRMRNKAIRAGLRMLGWKEISRWGRSHSIVKDESQPVGLREDQERLLNRSSVSLPVHL